MSAFLKFILLVIFGIIITFCNLDDYQIILSETSINKLIQHLIPRLTEDVLALVIPPQTFEGTAADVELGEISVHNLTIDKVAVRLEADTQTVDVDVIHMTLELNRFAFKASVLGSSLLSCSGFLTPAFNNWNLSVAIGVTTNSCNISVQFIDSETVVTGDNVQLNEEFGSKACDVIFSGADWLLDIEQKLEEEIIGAIPNMINNELQASIDGVMGQMQSIDDIFVCYNNITIYTDHILVAGDFIMPKVVQASSTSTTEYVDIDPEEPPNDDNSLFVFFLIIAVLSCVVGCGSGVGIFCGCNKDKLKKVKASKTSSHKIHAEPLRVSDDMTDDDGTDFETTNYT